MITAIKTFVCIIGLAAMAMVGIALFFVLTGIILSFFGKNIYLEDLEDENRNRKMEEL